MYGCSTKRVSPAVPELMTCKRSAWSYGRYSYALSKIQQFCFLIFQFVVELFTQSAPPLARLVAAELLRTLIWNDLCDFFRHNRVMTKMLAVGLFCFIRGSSQMVSGTWTHSELPGQLVPKVDINQQFSSGKPSRLFRYSFLSGAKWLDSLLA